MYLMLLHVDLRGIGGARVTLHGVDGKPKSKQRKKSRERSVESYTFPVVKSPSASDRERQPLF